MGQLKVADKSNEITALPEILEQLYITGAIVTLDAMGCQEDTIAQICAAHADYVVALKGNQGTLHEVVKDSFDLLDKGATALQANIAKDEIDGQHGRIDQREIQVIDVSQLSNMLDERWQGLNSIARITCASEFERAVCIGV